MRIIFGRGFWQNCQRLSQNWKLIKKRLVLWPSINSNPSLFKSMVCHHFFWVVQGLNCAGLFALWDGRSAFGVVRIVRGSWKRSHSNCTGISGTSFLNNFRPRKKKMRTSCEWFCECSQVEICEGSGTLCKFSLASTEVVKGWLASMLKFKKLAPGLWWAVQMGPSLSEYGQSEFLRNSKFIGNHTPSYLCNTNLLLWFKYWLFGKKITWCYFFGLSGRHLYMNWHQEKISCLLRKIAWCSLPGVFRCALIWKEVCLYKQQKFLVFCKSGILFFFFFFFFFAGCAQNTFTFSFHFIKQNRPFFVGCASARIQDC